MDAYVKRILFALNALIHIWTSTSSAEYVRLDMLTMRIRRPVMSTAQLDVNAISQESVLGAPTKILTSALNVMTVSLVTGWMRTLANAQSTVHLDVFVRVYRQEFAQAARILIEISPRTALSVWLDGNIKRN
jgi:hypothetical protein